MNAARKIWQLLMRRLSTVQEPDQTLWLSLEMMDTKERKLELGTVCHFDIFPVPQDNPHKNLPCAFYETARLSSACTPLPVNEAPSAGPPEKYLRPCSHPLLEPSQPPPPPPPRSSTGCFLKMLNNPPRNFHMYELYTVRSSLGDTGHLSGRYNLTHLEFPGLFSRCSWGYHRLLNMAAYVSSAPERTQAKSAGKPLLPSHRQTDVLVMDFKQGLWQNWSSETPSKTGVLWCAK